MQTSLEVMVHFYRKGTGNSVVTEWTSSTVVRDDDGSRYLVELEEVGSRAPWASPGAPPAHARVSTVTRLNGRPQEAAAPRTASPVRRPVRAAPEEWRKLLPTADEWFIAYSMPPNFSFVHIRMFLVGHAVEVYLKAAHAKIFGDLRAALAKGHRIDLLLSECQAADHRFMADYRLKPHILRMLDKLLLLDLAGIQQLSKGNLDHYGHHQELYMVAKHLPDLKYYGAPWKKLPGSPPLGFVWPNDYWIQFFRELRAYLGYPGAGGDHIKFQLDDGWLPPESERYLRRLYT